MTEPPIPLTALSEVQRAQATQRFTIIRSALEDGVTQIQVASTHNISVSTVRWWVKRYREKGVPRGRGKVERFFRSVDQLFLQDVPGYFPKGYPDAETVLTLPAFEQRF